MTDTQLLQDALAICLALKQTLITPELEDAYQQNFEEAQRQLRSAIGEVYLKRLSGQHPDDPAPDEPPAV